jgi:hypothetical protein
MMEATTPRLREVREMMREAGGDAGSRPPPTDLDQTLIDAEQLRRHSKLLLAHARELREEAEAARLRAAQRREASEQALASLRERRSLSAPALDRHAARLDRSS